MWSFSIEHAEDRLGRLAECFAGRFDRRTARIDFTLCDPNGQIVALIELDDVSHDTKEDRDEARNYIYRAAGYRLFRFDCRRMPEAAQIRETIIQGSR